jgi:prepilin-type N-terminal cleavage/methylation domain-containing protein
MNSKRKDWGFTLIEIVLVLAIAGLLLVVVFLAVSGAQRARRDFTRKHDAAALVGAVQQYASNHQLDQPKTQAETDVLVAAYFQRRDPSTGAVYAVDFHDNDSPHDLPVPALGHVTYVSGHICGTDTGSTDLVDDPPIFGVETHRFAVVMALEQGIPYCMSGDN